MEANKNNQQSSGVDETKKKPFFAHALFVFIAWRLVTTVDSAVRDENNCVLVRLPSRYATECDIVILNVTKVKC